MKKHIETLICSGLLLSAPLLSDEGGGSHEQATIFKSGEEVKSTQMPAGYNHAARVATVDGWDTFVTASFFYWNVSQEGMDIGPLGSSFGRGNQLPNLKTLEFPHKYQSGFKVGLGWNTPFDDWVISLDYTWFHHAIYQKQPQSLLLSSNFFRSTFDSSSHKWTIDLDRVGMLLSRPCYQGKRFTLIPSFGLTGLFLDQKYTVKGVVNTQTAGDGTIKTDFMKTDSWAVGPLAALEGRFLLGAGFRLVGSLAGALTYTRYNGIQYFTDGLSPGGVQQPNKNIRGSDENRVRAIGEVEAGFGWGMYLCNQKYHIDFSATYEFQVFWNQNMIGWYVNTLNKNASGYSPGNLYFQGLTVSGAFDF